MRIPVVFTVLAFGLGIVGCHKSTAYLNADEVSSVWKGTPNATPCNEVEQQGPDVDLAAAAETAPGGGGGTIEDGTYVMTSSTLHTTGRPHGTKLVAMGKVTVVVKGGTSQMVRTTADGRERRTTITREASGKFATLHTTCTYPVTTGTDSTSTTMYSATRNSFQFITPGPAGTVVTTYTKL